MSQVPVKWVLEKDLFVSKERVSDYEERDNIACPVVPLSALRKWLEDERELSINHGEEGYVSILSLLASLGE